MSPGLVELRTKLLIVEGESRPFGQSKNESKALRKRDVICEREERKKADIHHDSDNYDDSDSMIILMMVIA